MLFHARLTVMVWDSMVYIHFSLCAFSSFAFQCAVWCFLKPNTMCSVSLSLCVIFCMFVGSFNRLFVRSFVWNQKVCFYLSQLLIRQLFICLNLLVVIVCLRDRDMTRRGCVVSECVCMSAWCWHGDVPDGAFSKFFAYRRLDVFVRSTNKCQLNTFVEHKIPN